jgi:hypothetical protein
LGPSGLGAEPTVAGASGSVGVVSSDGYGVAGFVELGAAPLPLCGCQLAADSQPGSRVHCRTATPSVSVTGVNLMPPRWTGHRAFQVVLFVAVIAAAVALVLAIVDYTTTLNVVLRAGQIVFYVYLLSQSIRTRRYYAQQG